MRDWRKTQPSSPPPSDDDTRMLMLGLVLLILALVAGCAIGIVWTRGY